MTFGQRLRDLRKVRNVSQKALAEAVGVNFTYLSKIENERLDFAQFPSEELIRKLAAALEADEDELLLLARKLPEAIWSLGSASCGSPPGRGANCSAWGSCGSC
jgi:HTH-type transcriptional regulator, competence development regulator